MSVTSSPNLTTPPSVADINVVLAAWSASPGLVEVVVCVAGAVAGSVDEQAAATSVIATIQAL